MMENEPRNIRLRRKQAVSMDEIVREYIKSMKLSAGLDTQRVFAAWDACSGAGPFTLKRFFRGGTLYITVNSSVVRSQLYFQRDVLVEKMNAWLAQDSLFSGGNRAGGFVRELVLR